MSSVTDRMIANNLTAAREEEMMRRAYDREIMHGYRHCIARSLMNAPGRCVILPPDAGRTACLDEPVQTIFKACLESAACERLVQARQIYIRDLKKKTEVILNPHEYKRNVENMRALLKNIKW